MKHAYSWARPVLAVLFSFIVLSASAQQAWRPFRPGLIYSYATQPTGGAAQTHTLRVDSAYATVAGDSVYAFNRLLRSSTPVAGRSFYYRSRNNLFGARLRWRPGTAEFFLDADADAQSATPTATLRLLPRVAVGTTWSASSQPVLTATLTSRILSSVLGQADSVVTITLSNSQVIQLGRQTGLLEGPQWLRLPAGGSAPALSWAASRVPQVLAQSSYYPPTLFGMMPGDELGYIWDPLSLTAIQCSNGVILRRFLTRQQTADSLVITFLEQMRTQTSTYPGCGIPGTVTAPVEQRRWAFSLRTGKSRQFPALPLLTGEYAAVTTNTLVMGLGNIASGGVGCSAPIQIRYQRVYAFQSGTPAGQYAPGIDFLGWQQAFGVANAATPGVSGLGAVHTFDVRLTYTRRTLPGSALYTCGSPVVFAGLLPTRAASAAALATLHPNPAAEGATLTLAQPARAGTSLRLTDALGRAVWRASVPAGQSAVAVPLAGQPAGLYLLHLTGADGAAATWKLTHE